MAFPGTIVKTERPVTKNKEITRNIQSYIDHKIILQSVTNYTGQTPDL